MDKNIGVYIHIPFCRQKCYYCDFNSYSGREHLAGAYFDALFNEIRLRAQLIGDKRVHTIFIGGGTPSLVIPSYITDLLEICSRYLKLDSEAEISMESNPGTLTYENLKIYKAAGINRLSIGLQAWQDNLLKSIGRIHNRRQFIDNLDAAVRAGFTNINADLIFGLPGQTFDDWVETLEAVKHRDDAVKHRDGSFVSFCDYIGVTHLSCYSLKIEEGTVFGDRAEAGALIAADDELDRKMYHYAIETLSKKGFRQYELSNFAIPGYECKHNLVYWKALEYAGFGAGAHSYLNGVRFSNTVSIEEYIRDVDSSSELVDKVKCNGKDEVRGRLAGQLMGEVRGPLTEEASGEASVHNAVLYKGVQIIDRTEAMSEFLILGLRLTDGITSEDFNERFGESIDNVFGDKLEKLVNRGLLARESTNYADEKCGNSCILNNSCAYRYRLTTLGMDLANQVFVEFI